MIGVSKLLDKYDSLPLECDGMTRVLTYVLTKNNIEHTCYGGTITVRDDEFTPHFWIVLKDGQYVDYRIKMWFKGSVPNGVFDLKKYPFIKYNGKAVKIKSSEFMFNILTR